MNRRIKVSSNLGTMLSTYESWCREFVGKKADTWIVENYVWYYQFTFKEDSAATMFSLRWVDIKEEE